MPEQPVASDGVVAIWYPAERDRADVIAAARASRSLHASWVAAPGDDGAYDDYLDRSARPNQACYLLRSVTGDGVVPGPLVGVVNASEIVRGVFQSCYLGYYAFAGGDGRGLMTRGLAVVIGHLFGQVGLHRVEANIQPLNARSIALVERLGFRKEGFSPRYLFIAGAWRDHERWALLADEWEPPSFGHRPGGDVAEAD